MTAYETLQSAQALDIELSRNGEKLHVRDSSGKMTRELKLALKIHKETILALLSWPGDALVQLRREIGEMAREEEEQWEHSHKLDPRWPPSAKVYQRTCRVEEEYKWWEMI